jgi:predicted deacetylase
MLGQDLDRDRDRPRRTIAVALHGIEPQTFERCALIRDWLEDHGVDRVTLLVIPARDLHPLGERSPAMVDWLRERRRGGDSIAQHGFHNRAARPDGSPRQLLALGQRHGAGEFLGLNERETRSAVHAGWRVLKLAGVEPDGFVAPAYAYTAALRRELAPRFRWWAGLLRVHRAGSERHAPISPAWSLDAAGPLSRVLSPAFVRAGSLLPTSTLRLDVHPSYLQHPRHMMALEWVLERTGSSRAAITYGELAENSEASSGLTAGRAA